MVLKLEAAKRALQGGVTEVLIVGGNSASAALAPQRFASARETSTSYSSPGTRVLREFSGSDHAAMAAI
jgi:hypothetical protein